MAIAWHVYDICDQKITLDTMKHPKGFRFPSCRSRNDQEIASRALQFYFEIFSLYRL